MDFNAYLTAIYALIVFAGGLTGYYVGHSKPSLIAGVAFGLLLGLCSYGMFKNSGTAKVGAISISGILALFFASRYLASYKFMPAGLMVILSVATFITLIFRK